MVEPRVLLIVATLGRRPAYLRETLTSIRSQSVPADVVIVAPADNEDVLAAAQEFSCQMLPDPGSLAKAINLGARSLKPHHEFINWLNDDDLLEPGSLAATIAALDANPKAVVAYGACRYIDPEGRQLWISSAGPWATKILSWGPDLIPQPGMLVRTSSWQQVGGLDESFQLAFDLDLLLKLKWIGPLIDVGQIVSSFRWHEDSLTVDGRGLNLQESELAKRRQLRGIAYLVFPTWQPVMRGAIRFAVQRVNARARKVASTS